MPEVAAKKTIADPITTAEGVLAQLNRMYRYADKQARNPKLDVAYDENGVPHLDARTKMMKNAIDALINMRYFLPEKVEAERLKASALDGLTTYELRAKAYERLASLQAYETKLKELEANLRRQLAAPDPKVVDGKLDDDRNGA